MALANLPSDGDTGWGPWLRNVLTDHDTRLGAAATTDQVAAKADQSGVTAALAGKADLVAGKIPPQQLPTIALGGARHDVTNQAAMLALTGLGNGDWAVWADGSVYLYAGNGADPALLSSWTAAEQSGVKVTSITTTTGVHSGAVALNATEVGAVATAAVGVPNGVAPLGSDSKVPAANLPTPPVLTVNGKTGAVVIDLATIGAAPATAAHPTTAAYSGDVITPGYVLTENGEHFEQTDTLSDLGVLFDVPAVGSTEVWRVEDWGGASPVTVADITVTPGVRLGRTPSGITYAQTPGHDLMCSQLSGTGNWHGQGVTLLVERGGRLTIPAALSTPAAPTVTRASATNTVTWTAVTGAYNYHVWRNGTWIGSTRATTATDPTGAAADTYQIMALAPRTQSALSTAASAGGAANIYTGFAAGVTSPTGFGSLIAGTGGTTPTTAPTDTMADVNGVRALVSTTGNVGNQNKNDDLGREFNSDTAAHVAWDEAYQYGYDQSTGQFDLALSSAHLVNTFALTTGVFFRVQPDGITPLLKSTAAGSVTWAGTTTPVVANTTLTTLAKQTLTGITADTAHDYGIRAVTIANGDGTVTARVYHGTTTQLAAGTLPQLGGDLVINAAAAAGIPAGWHWYHVYGKQGSTQTGTQQVRLARYSIKAG